MVEKAKNTAWKFIETLKLRLLKFSLKRTLIAVIVSSCVFGWFTNRVVRQRNSVKFVKSVGGSVKYDFEIENWDTPFSGVHPSKKFMWGFRDHLPKFLQENIPVDFLANVVLVDVSGCQISDLDNICNLKHVVLLNASNSKISNLKGVDKLEQLKWLALDETAIHSLTPLRYNQNLEYLDLTNTRVESLDELKDLKSLAVLNASKTQIVKIDSCASMKNLESLSLSNTRVESIEPLVDHPKIRSLTIVNTKISDASPIATIKNLSHFCVDSKTVSSEVWEMVKNSIPDCQVSVIEDSPR